MKFRIEHIMDKQRSVALLARQLESGLVAGLEGARLRADAHLVKLPWQHSNDKCREGRRAQALSALFLGALLAIGCNHAWSQEVLPAPPAPLPRVEYLERPPVVYPIEAKRDGIEGRVEVRLTISSTGVVTQADVEKSSGSAILDLEAIRAAKAARFRIAEGSPSATYAYTLPINFVLKPPSSDHEAFARADAATASEASDQRANQAQSDEGKKAELQRLSLEIERRMGSGTRVVTVVTPEPSLKSYVANYSRELEKLGTESFPKRNGVSVHGSIQATLTINSKGRVESFAPAEGSDKFLANFSQKLVKRFVGPPFPANFPEGTQRIIFSTRFDYRDD